MYLLKDWAVRIRSRLLISWTWQKLQATLFTLDVENMYLGIKNVYLDIKNVYLDIENKYLDIENI